MPLVGIANRELDWILESEHYKNLAETTIYSHSLMKVMIDVLVDRVLEETPGTPLKRKIVDLIAIFRVRVDSGGYITKSIYEGI